MSIVPDARRVQSAKRKLREEMLAKRRSVPHGLSAQAGEAVARHFADHPILAFAPSFAGYMAMRGEIDVLPIFDIMARYNKQTSLPRMEADRTLAFHQWQRGDVLIRHPELQVQEPSIEASLAKPSIVLVPLLAFDGDGYRLGYGGGFYDRTIAKLRDEGDAPKFIGVAYSAQEVEQVPTTEGDEPLDGILTEHGVSMF